jgi:hypothetical protein
VVSLWSSAAVAQIYESQGKSGAPVFSGQPSPGAKQVDLPPLNVVNTPQPAQPLPAPATPSYERITIFSPAQQDTVYTNTGAFDVQVSVSPALQAGDAFMVTLDGNVLPGRYTSANIALTAQDYISAAANSVQHSLAVAVVNSHGAVLLSSSPVTFYVHRSTRYAAISKKLTHTDGTDIQRIFYHCRGNEHRCDPQHDPRQQCRIPGRDVRREPGPALPFPKAPPLAASISNRF